MAQEAGVPDEKALYIGMSLPGTSDAVSLAV